MSRRAGSAAGAMEDGTTSANRTSSALPPPARISLRKRRALADPPQSLQVAPLDAKPRCRVIRETIVPSVRDADRGPRRATVARRRRGIIPAPWPPARIAADVPRRLENADLRVTVLEDGGHIAEVLDKASGVNPLWTPPWPSIEPSRPTTREHHPEYGDGVDAPLLAGIMGHNLCLDIFGGPSDAEAAAGLPVHGEASVAAVRHRPSSAAASPACALLPLAHLRVERRSQLGKAGWCASARRREPVGRDRPIGWTEHVTLGPPFLERGVTEFRASAVALESVRAAVRDRRLSRSPAPSSTGRTRRAPTGARPTSRRSPGARLRAPTRPTSWTSAEDGFFVAFSPRGAARVRLRLARLTFPGWDLGGECQPLTAALERRDPDPRAWSSACRPFRSPAVR